MFQSLLKLLKPEAGILGLLVSLLAFLRDRRKSKGDVSVQHYLEWVRRKDHTKVIDGQNEILTVLEGSGEHAEAARTCLEGIMGNLQRNDEAMGRVEGELEGLTTVQAKQDKILDTLSRFEAPGIPKGHLLVSAKVLESVISGVQGAGARILMQEKPDLSKAGTLVFAWLLGDRSPHMMLADYVGGVNASRLSLLLNEAGSLTVRAFDGSGGQVKITSAEYQPRDWLVAFVSWCGKELCLWVNGTKQGRAEMAVPFDTLGPLLLFGIDIEGDLSADAWRWDPDPENPGLNFQKNGIWHGSRMDIAMLYERVLQDKEILELTRDPYILIRPPICVDGKCPNCGTEVQRNSAREQDTRSIPEHVSTWYICPACAHECVKIDGGE